MADNTDSTPKPDAVLSRRNALLRLGLAAGTAYVAPTVLGLNRASAEDSYYYQSPPWGRPSKNKSSKGRD